MIHVDAVWLAVQPLDMRLGTEAALARVVKRAAAIISLLHSARINGHEPFAYLKDVLERVPTQPASLINELLPHGWKPT